MYEYETVSLSSVNIFSWNFQGEVRIFSLLGLKCDNLKFHSLLPGISSHTSWGERCFGYTLGVQIFSQKVFGGAKLYGENPASKATPLAGEWGQPIFLPEGASGYISKRSIWSSEPTNAKRFLEICLDKVPTLTNELPHQSNLESYDSIHSSKHGSWKMVVVSCKTNYFPCGKAHIQELHGTNYASFRESMFNSIFEGEKAEKGYINKNHRCCDFPQFSMPCHVSATSPAAFAARHRNARPRGATGTIYVRRWCWGEPIGVTNLMAGKQKEGKTQGFLLGLGVLKLPLPSLPFLPAKKWKFTLIFPGKKKII